MDEHQKLIRKPFTVAYATDPGTGRIAFKREYGDGRYEEFRYEYDVRGHLTDVWRNDCLVERYVFNGHGQRVRGMVCHANGYYDPTTVYVYDERGRLVRAGMTEYFYDAAGNLALSRSGAARDTSFVYEDTLLKEVRLPDGDMLRYEYDPGSPNPVGPARKFRNGALVMEYAWRDLFHLAACADRETGLVYQPHFDANGHLAAVRVHDTKRRSDMAVLFGVRGREAVLHCVCDQVGTPKAYRGPDNRPAKHLWYDSFGNCYNDTRPELHIPVGFAGGLPDRDTGLCCWLLLVHVRFMEEKEDSRKSFITPRRAMRPSQGRA